MPVKRPIGRETDFEELDVLFCRVLEQLPGDAFDNLRRGDAVLKDGEGCQHGFEVLQLVIDFDVLVQFVDIIRRQLQFVFFRNVNDRLRADRAFEVTVDFGLGDVVVFGVEVFHDEIS